MASCSPPAAIESNPEKSNVLFMVVLGIAQDGGYPQSGCYAPHCMRAWNDPSLKRKAVALGLVDPKTKKKWLFEATPDIREQLFELQKIAPDSLYEFAGIFLTHGHMGHYTGLMHLGKEVMNTQGINVYAMPRMQEYLSTNGPWSQLGSINNIVLQPLKDSTMVELTDDISVVPFTVPHRDEYTEVVGFQITGPGKSLIFIPDIDKWEKWDVNLAAIHERWDYVFVDATFFRDGELPGRDMSKILHPFVTESYVYFNSIPSAKKANVHFIHFNHTNPLLIDGSKEQKEVKANGFNYAFEGQVVDLE
ncbi:MAG: MBL fold metallo-hydrolase [Bacteroidetes bacterium]|nr:MBL fold metallo-hydrolase [Bacteroidota bacterium]